MKDDRYEIKGKIGQGGIGAVYRAFDRRLNRDVAIKRVLPEGGFENQEEAIEHLLKEAKSLSSVQHPHIVTVYDAGVDEEGPYVVMEVLDGRTLDEMIERGSLTYEDFREVAIQTQEALIAAQDLDLVHRDLKPTNVMVTWLPSGKFQMKLVDFGLAKFSPKPSLQTIDHGDAVFGSIHFMAPEQFERTPLDQRTDMYSMGCMYYFALTGLHPFSGDSAPDVMFSHLQHRVTPLAELRPDLPAWLTAWVMWHIERRMDNRPANARESLQRFLMTEQQNSETPEQTAPEQPKRPRLVFPGAEGAEPAPPPAATPPPEVAPPVKATPPTDVVPAAEISSGTAPQPVQPPAGLHPGTAPQPLQPPAGIQTSTAPQPVQPPAGLHTGTAPQPVHPPAGQTPGLHSASPVSAPPPPPAAPAPPPPPQMSPPAAPPQSPPVQIQPAAPPAPAPALHSPPAPQLATPPGQIRLAGAIPPPAASVTPAPPLGPGRGGPSTVISGSTKVKHQGMSTAAKATIAAVLLVAVIIAAFVLIGQSSINKDIERFNALVAEVDEVGARDLPTTAKDIDILLGQARNLSQLEQRQAIYQRLLVAESSDGTDLDEKIARVASDESQAMLDNVRVNLFKVLQGRRSPSALEHLLKHAQVTGNDTTAAAALEAVERIATDKDLGGLVRIIEFNDNVQVRQAAKRVINSLATRSEAREQLATELLNAYRRGGATEKSKLLLLELLGTAGGEEAAAIVKEALASEDNSTRLAAVAALGNWADDSQFETLLDFIGREKDDTVRSLAFDAAFRFLKMDRKRDQFDLEDMWKALAYEATSKTEKLKLVTGLAQNVDDWAFAVAEFFVEDENNDVSYQAERVLERMEEIRRNRDARQRNADDKDEDEGEGEDQDEDDEQDESEDEPENDDSSDE